MAMNQFYNQNRNSGYDFSDGKVPSLDQHPDMAATYAVPGTQPSHLQRNKTERRRLQGLQRSNTTVSTKSLVYKPNSWREKWDHWMINEGGKRLFFAAFLLLHALVIAFGFMHYSLKDNSVGARSIFGVTFRKSPPPLLDNTKTNLILIMTYHYFSFPLSSHLLFLFYFRALSCRPLQPSPVPPLSPSMSTSLSSSSPSAAPSSPSSVALPSTMSSPSTKT